VEVPSGGITDILTSRNVDPFSAKVVLKKLNVKRFLTVTATDFRWSAAPSLTSTDTRIFRKGEIFEIVDGPIYQTVSLDADTNVVGIPIPINPVTVKIYRIFNFDITDGKVWLDTNVIRAESFFPLSERIRIEDVYGAVGFEVQDLATSLDLGRAVEDQAGVFLLSGKIIGGYTASTDGVRLARSFMEGAVILVQMTIDEPNDHAEHYEVTTAVTQDIFVAPTRPFNLTALLLEKPGFPIQVFVDGMLQPPDTYTFISTIQVRLTGFMPVGTEVDVHWVDLEDPRPHLHIDDRFLVATPIRVFQLSDALSPDFARYVSIDGVTVGDPADRRFTPTGDFLVFSSVLPVGTLVRVRGAKVSFAFYHDIDPEIVRADYLQDGIEQKSVQIPGGWQTQLAWETDFLITKGLLESNAVVENAWFVNVLIDEQTAYSNFGQLIGFRRDTSAEYVRILRALFSGGFSGCLHDVMEGMICILLGSQYLGYGGEIKSISGLAVETERETLALDAEVPSRVSAGETYPKLTALSAFAEIVDTAPAEFLPQAGEEFSSDYRFAHAFDTREPTIFEGGPGDYYTLEHVLEDLAADFVEENVWPGDLVRLAPIGFTPVYCRVTSVEQHRLLLTSDLTGAAVAYGEEDYGEWVYGGGILIISNVYYRIWTRDIDRLDEERSLDRAREEDIPYLNYRISDLLDPFVFLVQLRWKSLRSDQALRDVLNYLERTTPAEGSYLVFSRAYEEEGIRDDLSGTLTDTDPSWTQLPDFLFISEGFVGINGQVAPNAGSFVGTP
jgi:hypothetical protein